MGWPDIRKINSDFMHEPLNFNNYINDISTFGKYSYALDAENENLWLSLISQSLTLFGHDAIHDTVYERFTDDEVDYMITKNARLGQSFNSFYSIDDFASGPVDTVLKSITIAAYNKLDIKFQNGINRYISANTSENAGTWLTSVFDIDMSSYQTMDDLLADTAFWNSTVASNESLRFVISLSVSSAEYMASHTDSSIYVSFIETVAQSTDATMTLINALAATAQLETFFANESVCTAIANSAPSMTAICYNTDGFAAMIASETAMNIVAASETAVNVIVDGITNATNSESVLDGIKGNLTSIEESLPSIANTETVIAEVADVKENISGVVTALRSVTSQTDILVSNIDALLASETAIASIVGSEAAMKALLSSETTKSLISEENVITLMTKSPKCITLDSTASVTGKGMIIKCELKNAGAYSGMFDQYAVGGYALTIDSESIFSSPTSSSTNSYNSQTDAGILLPFENNFELQLQTARIAASGTVATATGYVKYVLYE